MKDDNEVVKKPQSNKEVETLEEYKKKVEKKFTDKASLSTEKETLNKELSGFNEDISRYNATLKVLEETNFKTLKELEDELPFVLDVKLRLADDIKRSIDKIRTNVDKFFELAKDEFDDKEKKLKNGEIKKKVPVLAPLEVKPEQVAEPEPIVANNAPPPPSAPKAPPPPSAPKAPPPPLAIKATKAKAPIVTLEKILDEDVCARCNSTDEMKQELGKIKVAVAKIKYSILGEKKRLLHTYNTSKDEDVKKEALMDINVRNDIYYNVYEPMMQSIDFSFSRKFGILADEVVKVYNDNKTSAQDKEKILLILEPFIPQNKNIDSLFAQKLKKDMKDFYNFYAEDNEEHLEMIHELIKEIPVLHERIVAQHSAVNNVLLYSDQTINIHDATDKSALFAYFKKTSDENDNKLELINEILISNKIISDFENDLNTINKHVKDCIAKMVETDITLSSKQVFSLFKQSFFPAKNKSLREFFEDLNPKVSPEASPDILSDIIRSKDFEELQTKLKKLFPDLSPLIENAFKVNEFEEEYKKVNDLKKAIINRKSITVEKNIIINFKDLEPLIDNAIEQNNWFELRDKVADYAMIIADHKKTIEEAKDLNLDDDEALKAVYDAKLSDISEHEKKIEAIVGVIKQMEEAVKPIIEPNKKLAELEEKNHKLYLLINLVNCFKDKTSSKEIIDKKKQVALIGIKKLHKIRQEAPALNNKKENELNLFNIMLPSVNAELSPEAIADIRNSQKENIAIANDGDGNDFSHFVAKKRDDIAKKNADDIISKKLAFVQQKLLAIEAEKKGDQENIELLNSLKKELLNNNADLKKILELMINGIKKEKTNEVNPNPKTPISRFMALLNGLLGNGNKLEVNNTEDYALLADLQTILSTPENAILLKEIAKFLNQKEVDGEALDAKVLLQKLMDVKAEDEANKAVVSGKDAEIKDLKAKLAAVKPAIDQDQKAVVNDNSAEIKALRKKIEELEDDNIELKEDLKVSDNRNNILNEELDDLNQENNDLSKELQEIKLANKEEVEELYDKVEDLEDKLELENGVNKELTDAVKKLSNELEMIKLANEDKDAEIRNLKAKQIELEEDKLDLADELEVSKKSKDILDKEKIDLEQGYDDLEQVLTEMKQAELAKEAEVDTIIKDFQAKLKALEDENNALKAQNPAPAQNLAPAQNPASAQNLAPAQNPVPEPNPAPAPNPVPAPVVAPDPAHAAAGGAAAEVLDAVVPPPVAGAGNPLHSTSALTPPTTESLYKINLSNLVLVGMLVASAFGLTGITIGLAMVMLNGLDLLFNNNDKSPSMGRS